MIVEQFIVFCEPEDVCGIEKTDKEDIPEVKD